MSVIVGGGGMVDEVSLSEVLSELARTLTTDFPIQAILDHLVERIVDVLDVSAAGVTLISPGRAPHYVAASDDDALAFERLQSDLGHGPCLTAFESGDAVAVPDLAGDGRFGGFAPAALRAGMRAVFAFPLRHGSGRLGALDLYRDRAGEPHPREMAAAQTLADVTAAYLLNAQAREEARAVSDRFRASALHDALTGLPNRALLQQRIEHAARRAHRSHTQAAVLFVDLDRFTWVNDTYGHRTGDELLVGVAGRLSEVVRPGDTLARVSGDEFVILCEDMVDVGDALRMAARLGDAFGEPFTVGGVEIVCSVSVGVAYSGPGEGVTDQLVSHADVAMYQAKRRGGATHQVVHLGDAPGREPSSRPDRGPAPALATGQPALAYQPIVRTRDGVVHGVEAVLRWTHPERGEVPGPTTNGPAERDGLEREVGAWVLARACADRNRWLAGHPDRTLDVTVDVSVGQFLASGFTGTVADALERTGTDPAALVLEMTERVFVEDFGRAAAVLTELRSLGVRSALGDFGTGYGSLSYLRRLPVDDLTIGRGLVADIGRDPSGAAVLSAVSNLAHALGLRVTAEGVETRAQHDAVVATGCELAQGLYYGGPGPGSGVPGLLGGIGGARRPGDRGPGTA